MANPQRLCIERGWHKWGGHLKHKGTCHIWRHCQTCGGWGYVRPGRRSSPEWVGHPPGCAAGEYEVVEQEVVEQEVVEQEVV